MTQAANELAFSRVLLPLLIRGIIFHSLRTQIHHRTEGRDHFIEQLGC
jgi:hypothetical protein